MGHAHGKGATSQAWYAGKITKPDADALVCANPSGSYLIRDSGDVYHLVINDHGSAQHYLIQRNDDGKLVMGTRKFDDLEAVVKFLHQRGIKGKNGKLRLGVPVGGSSDDEGASGASPNADWFAPHCSVDDAMNAIGGGTLGDYLVVPSNTQHEYLLLVRNDKDVTRVPVMQGAGESVSIGSAKFSSVSSLISSLLKHGLKDKGKVVKLVRPVAMLVARGSADSAGTSSSAASADPPTKKSSSSNGGAAAFERVVSNDYASTSTGKDGPDGKPQADESNQYAVMSLGGRRGGAAGAAAAAATPQPSTPVRKPCPGVSDEDQQSPWFAGAMSKGEGERLVTESGPGDFLIRKSETQDKLFHFVVNDGGTPVHYKIDAVPGGYKLAGMQFETLVGVVKMLETRGIKGRKGKISLRRPALLPAPAEDEVGNGGIRPRTSTAWERPVSAAQSMPTPSSESSSSRPRLTTQWSKPSRSQAAPPPASAAAESSYGESDDMAQQVYVAALDVDGFLEMSRRSTTERDLPEYGVGKTVNRYRNILPNPVTRVRLSVVDGDEATEYINANFVRGFGDRNAREYIAAQAPMPSTVASFIRMIWEKDIDTIVMVTGLKEKGRTKCERYWPESSRDRPMSIGSFVIKTTRTESKDGYLVSTLQISRDSAERTVTHYWLNSWPDHGVPVGPDGTINTDSMIAMLKDVRTHRTDIARSKGVTESPPLLVHCSAGIGRTGTYIIIDQAYSAMQAGKRVDLLDLIDKIRQDRMSMVQETSQLKFAYQAAISLASEVAKPENVFAIATKQSTIQGLRRDKSWKPAQDGGADATGGNGGSEMRFRLTHRNTGVKLEADERTILVPAEEGAPPAAGSNTSLDLPLASSQQQASPSLARKARPLELQPWFRTGLSREQIEQTLQDTPAGTFLVRPSSIPGHYALTLNEGDQIVSLLIVPVEEGGKTQFRLGQTGTNLFDSVAELVQYFEENPVRADSRGEHVRLKDAQNPTEDEEEC